MDADTSSDPSSVRHVGAEFEVHFREQLGAEANSLLPFLSAVTEQTVYRLGEDIPAAGDAALERRVGERALAVVREARLAGSADAPPGRGDAAAARLARDPAMLAAFFQNVDLLFIHDAPAAEQVAALVLEATARIDASGTPPPPASNTRPSESP